MLVKKPVYIIVSFWCLLFSIHFHAQQFVDDFKITSFKVPIETNTYNILEDSYGFVWIGSTNGLWRYDGSNFKNYVKNENDETSITDNQISSIYEDKQKTLWIGTYGGGLLRYDRNCDCFQRFIHDDKNEESISFNEVRTIFETSNNQFYIGTDGGGLNLMNRNTNTFKSFKFNANDSTSISHNNVLSIEELPNKDLAIGTWYGLNIFDTKNQSFKRIYKHPLTEPQYHFTLEYSNEKLITNSKRFYSYDFNNEFTLLDNFKRNSLGMKMSNDNNCWFLTLNSVFIADSELNVKQEINLKELFNSEKNIFLTNIYHNKLNSSTWLLDRLGNFYLVEKKVSPFKQFTKNYFKGKIYNTNSNFWISFGKNIYILDKQTKKHKKLNINFKENLNIATNDNENVWVVDDQFYYEFSTSGQLVQKIKQNTIPRSLALTQKKQLWIGEILGASRYDIATNENIKYKCDWNAPNGIGYFHRASIIFEDIEGKIWIGTQGDGIKRYVPESDEFIHYRHKIGDNTTIKDNFVNEIFEDKQQNLWIGTKSGLCRLDKTTNTFIQYELPILKDKIIKSIEQDVDNNLWIGTPNGLIKYDYIDNKIRILTEQDGLLSNDIGSSSLSLENNELVFNTGKGLMVFNPEQVKESEEPSKLYISKLWVNNEIVTSNSSYISKNIEVENKVDLNYDDKKFEFEFQVINFNNNDRCKFAYKLDGYDKSWINAQNNQKATYTNIPSGDYTFMVKATNEHGIWSDKVKQIEVTIKPPFWELLWVKIVALLSAILIFLLIFWLVIKKERNRSKFEIEKERVSQFEELTKMKLKFFTNISHELRTPLSLITSPLEKFVQENTKPNNKVLEMMHRNSSRLLELVNQILDFRKLESNPELQVISQKDFSVFNNVIASSNYWSKEKDITFVFELPKTSYELFFDADVLEKIVTNLISNAFKYTPQKGKVELLVSFKDLKINNKKVESGQLEIHVIDNGSGIPLEYHEKVFERFYQLDENPDFGYSSGIGLSLTAELVKLHKGTIELKEAQEKGCHFKVEIPIGYDHYSSLVLDTENTPLEIDTEKTLVLIVEDNNDIRNYIHDELKDNYQVIEAKNGKEGLQMALSTLPDVVISDIMMPESDGIQFANQLKSNDLTSHIPLLFLTAKTGLENKIAGLTTGAEDYIQKPFNISEIKLKIKNVLESRNQLLKKFKQNSQSENETNSLKETDKYLQKVNLVLEEHLENSEFSVENLCSELGIGRSQLYRKIQVLTGKSIIEYINFYKLSIAMQFIQKGDLTLKEIAYKVGYNDNRYFSRSFKKEFGNPPSYYRSKKASTK